MQQNEALITAISEILWNIGEKVKVVIVLTGETNLIPHSHTYFQDSVTEKVPSNNLLLEKPHAKHKFILLANSFRIYKTG